MAKGNDQTQSLAQADLLLWFALWLSNPDDQVRAELDGGDMAGLLRAGGLDNEELAVAVEALQQRQVKVSSRGWQDEYHRLFETGGVCPIEEASYVRRDKGAILGDVCGFYRAFGFSASTGEGDRPDHLATELQFAALLLVMLARAHWASDAEAVQITQEAMAGFAYEHLDEWLELFCERLESISVLSIYVQLAPTLRLFWRELVAMYHWPRAERVAVRMPNTGDAPGSPYECGMSVPTEHVELRVGDRPLANERS